MIKDLYDKTSKVSFSVYKEEFLEYFGEYRKIIEELETELNTLYGVHRRLDKLVLVDDNTLQNWEFHFKPLSEDNLKNFWEYYTVKSAQTGLKMDTFIVSFADPGLCEENVKIGRVVHFAPIIKYLQKMGLHKKLNTIEEKVKNNKKISMKDELTLIFVTLATKDKFKENMVKRVCALLKQIDYIDEYRRIVIDSLISFQIENFVKSKKLKNELNEVVNMQVPVEELFLQVERESQYNEGFQHGITEGKKEGIKEGKKEGIKDGKDEVILNMLKESVDLNTIQKFVGCSKSYILKLKSKYVASK